MSLHYLLDGYNVTKQIPTLARKRLKGERESLVGLIEIHRPQGSQRNKITIVFDGRPGITYSHRQSNVKIIFSKDESGDEKIRSIIQSAVNKKTIIVITDDKELKFSVRALGARVLNVKDFLTKINISLAGHKVKKARNKIQEDCKQIPKTLEHKITAELREIWLGEPSRKLE